VTTLGHLGVLGVALAVLAGVLVWAAGDRPGAVLQYDLVLEPLFVIAGVVFLWLGLTRGRDG